MACKLSQYAIVGLKYRILYGYMIYGFIAVSYLEFLESTLPAAQGADLFDRWRSGLRSDPNEPLSRLEAASFLVAFILPNPKDAPLHGLGLHHCPALTSPRFRWTHPCGTTSLEGCCTLVHTHIYYTYTEYTHIYIIIYIERMACSRGVT